MPAFAGHTLVGVNHRACAHAPREVFVEWFEQSGGLSDPAVEMSA
jgi:hypothetical protein